MTKRENEPIPLRKSERIAQIIAKANQVAAIDWLHAILEEHAEPARQELAGLQALTQLSERSMPVLDLKAIEAPVSARSRGARERWEKMTKKERAEQLSRMASARWGDKKQKSTASSDYWARMTPEERSVEMKRRIAKRGQPQELTLAERLKLHPRDKRSPRHEEFVKKARKAAQRRYENMSVRERKQWVSSMQQGRAQHINGAAL